MSLAALTNVLNIIRGDRAGVDDHLYKEVLLMTLARASRADANIDPVEVATVRDLVNEITGEAVTDADVRIAAASELYETTSLERALGRVRARLTGQQRASILQALAKVIRADCEVTTRETAFYDMVAGSLAARPSEIAGLTAPE